MCRGKHCPLQALEYAGEHNATPGSAYLYNRIPCVQLLHIHSMLMLIFEESVYTSPAET